jgi:mannose/fructose-specific phosphotransferase system component IIA
MSNKPLSPFVVVVAHAPLAAALRAVAVHVLGEAAVAGSGAAFMDVAADAPPSVTTANIAAAVLGAQSALFLTDLPFATPHNCCVSAASVFSHTALQSHCTAAMVLRAVQNAHAAQPLGLEALVAKLQSA